jgi:hypothetical protein
VVPAATQQPEAHQPLPDSARLNVDVGGGGTPITDVRMRVLHGGAPFLDSDVTIGWGDGSVDDVIEAGTQATRQHSYSNPGRFVAELTIGDLVVRKAVYIAETNGPRPAASAPAVVLLVPNSAPAGSDPFVLSVVGSGYLNGRSIVTLDHVPAETTYVGPQHLRVRILPPADPRVVQVRVMTGPPGGGTSDPQNLTFTAPVEEAE